MEAPRSLRGWANTACWLILLTCLLEVLVIIEYFGMLDSAERMLDGASLYSEEAFLADAESLADLTSLLTILTLAAAIGYLIWLWRVRRFAELLEPAGHHHRRGWTIGGWFCPIVNLWFPYRIVRDIWHASQPPDADVRATIVGVWWASWLVSLGASTALTWAIPVPEATTSLREVLDGLEGLGGVITFATAVVFLCGLLAIRIIGRITRWQTLPQPARNLP